MFPATPLLKAEQYSEEGRGITTDIEKSKLVIKNFVILKERGDNRGQ